MHFQISSRLVRFSLLVFSTNIHFSLTQTQITLNIACFNFVFVYNFAIILLVSSTKQLSNNTC